MNSVDRNEEDVNYCQCCGEVMGLLSDTKPLCGKCGGRLPVPKEAKGELEVNVTLLEEHSEETDAEKNA